MTWRVLYRTAIEAWSETGADIRLPLVTWIETLSEHGPPVLVDDDHPSGLLRTIAPTGHLVEYFVDEDQRLIALVRIR